MERYVKMYLKLYILISILLLLISIQTNTMVYSIPSIILTTIFTIYFYKNRFILIPIINILIQEYTLSKILRENISGTILFIMINLILILQLENIFKQYYRAEIVE